MTREKKFTPGPWKAELHLNRDNRILSDNIDDGSAAVCSMNGCWVSDTRENANAHLIAAAPELLEALEIVTGKFKEIFEIAPNNGMKVGCISQFSEEEYMAAKSAIKKAYGETP